MKLSDAIRKGSEVCAQQIHGSMFEWCEGQLVGACAVGMAYIGWAGPPEWDEYDADELIAWKWNEDEICWVTPDNLHFRQVEAAFDTQYTVGACPDPSCSHADTTIMHLNDNHRWTVEQIAGYYEALGR